MLFNDGKNLIKFSNRLVADFCEAFKERSLRNVKLLNQNQNVMKRNILHINQHISWPNHLARSKVAG